MKSYLVDFENVKSKGLAGIEKLTADDHVVIFYSENSDTISFEMHCSVMRAAASVEYMKVNVGGKNALDFQLSTLLGYMVALKTNTHIFIISNDKGFDKLHDFWENTFADAPDCVVYRTGNIAAAINYAKNRRTAERSMSAQIVVVPEEETAVAEETAQNSDEPKFIVPEPMLEKFRNDPDGSEARRKKREELDKNLEPQDEAKDDEAAVELLKSTVVENAEPPQPTQPSKPPFKQRFPKHRTPEESLRENDLYTEPEFKATRKALKDFIEDPANRDKHEVLKRYFPDDSDETVNELKEYILNSTCRPDLHNLLMKHYGSEDASRYYNTIKPHYDFFKSVLPEDSAIEEAEKKARELREKLERIKPIELEVKPALVETAAEEKKDKEKSAAKTSKKKAEKPVPKKVDAAMKKKLHTLLDDAATTDEFSGIVAQINQSATSQQLYINMMQRFKKDRGRELYKLIKGEFKQFLSESAPAAQTEVSEDISKVEEEATQIETVQAEPKKVTAAMKRKLHMLLDEPATTDEFSGIVAQINQSANEEQLLANMTQRFGSARGGELYTIIKDEYVKFISEKPRTKRKSAANKSGAKATAQSPAPVQASREDLEKMLHEQLDGWTSDEEFSAAFEVAAESDGRHGLYLGMVKKFGRQRGLVIYNRIKNEYEKLTEKTSVQ